MTNEHTSSEKNNSKWTGKDNFWDFMGCLPAAIAVAIIIWAFSGFPGLAN